MTKILKNIDRILIPVLSLAALLYFGIAGCLEYRLAVIFFLLSIICSVTMLAASFRFFHQGIPAIIGSTLIKMVLLFFLMTFTIKAGGYDNYKLLPAFLISFVVSKLFEMKFLRYFLARQSVKRGLKGC